MPDTVQTRAWSRLRRILVLAPLLLPWLARASQIPPTAFDVKAYHGRIVLVDFWASWCKPCRQSIPWFNELEARYGPQGLTIVGINVDADHRDAERFLRDTPVDFDLVFDPQGTLASRFKVPGMPATYVFDRDGGLAERHLGFKEAQRADFEATLKALLARHPDS